MAKKKIQLPLEAAQTLKELGQNLRIARLRRNMTMEDMAGRIGIHRETLAMAEKGNPNVSIGNYIGALWVLGLLSQMSVVAAPDSDDLGRSLGNVRERARSSGGMSNDF